jgi:hypothetical protein
MGYIVAVSLERICEGALAARLRSWDATRCVCHLGSRASLPPPPAAKEGASDWLHGNVQKNLFLRAWPRGARPRLAVGYWPLSQAAAPVGKH